MENLFGGFYKNRKVFITGHTGFKGSWLCLLLNKLGADIYGYSLEPPTEPSLYEESGADELVTSYTGDIRDYGLFLNTIQKVKPEIVFHLAAQSLVRESYKNPVETYSVNVIGTVNILQAVRLTPSVKAVVNVTTDKCYENREWHWGYRENDPMGGYDPYSNSKGCSELVTSSFRNSFFNSGNYEERRVALASARAGNVIGGGDWAQDRLIPDFIRAVSNGKKVNIRSPYAFRPWQHVLEPLTGYLKLAAKLFVYGPKYAEGWNFGPDDRDIRNVEWVINKVCSLWGEDASYTIDTNPHPHEANFLKLDCSKAKAELDWNPQWDIETTLKYVVDWHKTWMKGGNTRELCEQQIEEYFREDRFDAI